MENAYVVIAVSKILQDTYANQFLTANWLKNYINLCALNNGVTKTLQYHPYLNNYITARIDIKNTGDTSSDINIIEISDKNARITTPEWFAKNGKGYVIESISGKLNIGFKCIHTGKLSITLRGKDIRNRNNERIPFWIDFCSMEYNGQVIFKNIKSVWHDEPFIVNRRVVDGEVVFLSLEWKPCDRGRIESISNQHLFIESSNNSQRLKEVKKTVENLGQKSSLQKAGKNKVDSLIKFIIHSFFRR